MPKKIKTYTFEVQAPDWTDDDEMCDLLERFARDDEVKMFIYRIIQAHGLNTYLKLEWKGE